MTPQRKAWCGLAAANGLPDGLTQGDFAVAQRRWLSFPDADTCGIRRWLEDELSAGSNSGSDGFEVPKPRRMLTAEQQSR